MSTNKEHSLFRKAKVYTDMITEMILAQTGDAAEGIAAGIETGFDTIYSQIKAVANPIGVAAVAVCGLYLIFGSDPSYIKKAKSWGISIFFGILVINFADKLVTWALNTLQ